MEIDTKKTLRKQVKKGTKIKPTSDGPFDDPNDILTVEEVFSKEVLARSSKHLFDDCGTQKGRGVFITRAALKIVF